MNTNKPNKNRTLKDIISSTGLTPEMRNQRLKELEDEAKRQKAQIEKWWELEHEINNFMFSKLTNDEKDVVKGIREKQEKVFKN